ncbi:MAG: 4-alpha-glucanotransferase [Armatimonadetes bacterium]|nr:4-alpha-glucanotransferase [Armatimonadota bacterium]
MVSQKSAYPQTSERLLDELAALYGVPTGYRDTKGRSRESPRESVRAVVSALGADVGAEHGQHGDEARLKSAVETRRAELEARLVEPVLVAWEGVLPPDFIRPPVDVRDSVELALTLESGEEWRWRGDAARLATEGSGTLGSEWVRLPLGYHRLHVQTGRSTGESTVIAAPRRCWAPEQVDRREWGVFAPLYALRSERDWGAGDLADLESLAGAVAAAGGSVVSVLPLLAAHLDDPFEPSPYRPVSRLFWNEFYLAVERIPEWERCAEARGLWASADVQARVARLRAEQSVDYREVMAVKKRALEVLCRCFFGGSNAGRTESLAQYARTHPDVEDYAAFRARAEVAPVHREEVRSYHLYCQWQMEEQLDRLTRRGAAGLLLDLPVGVHPDGFDTWRWPQLFAPGMSFGAPPDSFFTRGQNWDSPPLQPEQMRAGGHRYFAQSIRHHMRHARYLRIDHIMALHRLFWIPEGAGATDGVYVGYPAEELYAVLCLESQCNRTVVVGEDLGTVPPGVRSSMRRHGVLSTWVLQSSVRPRAARPLGEAPRRVVASLGTHDMFPFAGFLRGDDVAARLQTGQVDAKEARRETAARHKLIARLSGSLGERPGAGPATLLRAALAWLAAGRAALVMVNLDDLLLETGPQNQPGTGVGAGNWRRKVRGSEEEVHRAIARTASVLDRRTARRPARRDPS